MKRFYLVFTAIYFSLTGFSAHGVTCKSILVNKFDTYPSKPFAGRETNAMRQAKAMLDQGLNNYATQPLEEKYEYTLIDDNSQGIEPEEAALLSRIYYGQSDFKASIRILTFALKNLKFETRSDRIYTIKNLANAHKRAAEAYADPSHTEREIEIRKLLVGFAPEEIINRRDLVASLIKLERQEEALVEVTELVPMALEAKMPNVHKKALLDKQKLQYTLDDQVGLEQTLRELLRLKPHSQSKIEALVKNLVAQRKYTSLEAFIDQTLRLNLESYPPTFILAAAHRFAKYSDFVKFDELLPFAEKYPGMKDRLIGMKQEALERNYDPDYYED